MGDVRQRQRLLIITRNFPPTVGGMERLNWHMAAELASCFDVRVIGPVGGAALAPRRVTVREVPLKPLWRFVACAAANAWREARSWRPHLVMCGSGLSAPMGWLAARVCGARCVVYVHGLDLVVPHPLYRVAWLPFIRRVDAVIANSRATAGLAEQIGVMTHRITVIHPGVEIPGEDHGAGAAFRERHGLGDRPLLLSVGRLTHRKGLREFVANVLPLIVQEMPEVTLLVVGDQPKQALFHEGVDPAAILAAAQAVGIEQRVLFLGKLSESELVSAYRAANVHVFPVRAIPNDPEGFGMVAVEAAAHGLPTVAYATGGVVDAVADGLSGRLVSANDALAFAQAVLDMLAHPLSEDMVRGFAHGFTWKNFGAALVGVLAKTPSCQP